MSAIEKGNFSEHDLTSQEWKERLEEREGKVIEEFEWQGEKGVVRYAQRGDEDGLLAIDRDRAEYRLQKYKKPKLKNPGGGDESLKKSLEEPDKQTLIVLKIGEEIVGYTTFGPELNTQEWGEDTVRVYTTSVLQMNPKYKRKNEKGEERGFGFGEKLRAHVIELAKSIYHAKHISSNVHKWNKPSIALWKKLGSKIVPGIEKPEKDAEGNPIMIYNPETKEMEESILIRQINDLEKPVT